MIDLHIIEELQIQFAEVPDAIVSLQTIFDCEGNLEDAAMDLAIRVGQHQRSTMVSGCQDWQKNAESPSVDRNFALT